MVSVKRELVKAAEAGALSGARGLWPRSLHRDHPRPGMRHRHDHGPHHGDQQRVDGLTLTTDEVTVEVGRWDYTAKIFTPGNNPPAPTASG